MIHLVASWLLVLGFAGAGVANLIGAPATQRSFVRWGYPPWWGRVTGALELVVAGLVALAATRTAGLVLGAAIILAAIFTVVRHRDFGHLLPLGVFAVALGVALSTV
ncbi:MAG: DoxX family protein [Caulobacteraceae bacterium]|nr:DoxX family protein [Caulobacter sp.]